MRKPILHVSFTTANAMKRLADSIKRKFGDMYDVIVSPKGSLDIKAENTTVVNLDLSESEMKIEEFVKYLEEIGNISTSDIEGITETPETMLDHIGKIQCISIRHKEFVKGVKYTANAGIATDNDVIEGVFSIINNDGNKLNKVAQMTIDSMDELDLTIASMEFILKALKEKRDKIKEEL